MKFSVLPATGIPLKPVWLFLFLVLSVPAFGTGSDMESGFDQAYKLYKAHRFGEALQICGNGTQSDPEKAAACLLIQGFVMMDSVSYEESEKYFLKAGPLLKQSKNLKLITKYHFGLGKIYFNITRFQESIREFLILEKLAIQNQMKPEEKSANYYLAQNFQVLHKTGLSNRYALRGVQLSKELKDTASIFRCYLSVINNYTAAGIQEVNEGDEGKKEGYKRGILFGDSALHLIEELKVYVRPSDDFQRGNIYDLISGAYTCKRDYTKSVRYAILAFEHLERAGDLVNAAASCNKVGDAFNDLKKYDSALIYLKKAEKLRKALQTGTNTGDERSFNYSFYRAYDGLNRYKEALEYLEKYFNQDLVLNENRNIDLQKMREQFETEKTNYRIKTETEKAQNLFEQKRRLYIYASAALLFLMGLIAWFLYYRFKIRKERKERNLQILLQTAELSALKAQMNPHFIFNALNSVQHSIVTNNTEDAYRFLSKFSKLIRNVLDSSAEPLIPLKTEIETLSLYMEIESKRFDNSFSFSITTGEESPDPETVQIPPMILQPFVENAIWHGLMPKEGEKEIKIEFSFPSSETIRCEISDNGIGRKKAAEIGAEKGHSHRSRGIANILDRIKLLEITLGLKIEIELTDEMDAEGKPAGTRVVVLFTNSKPK